MAGNSDRAASAANGARACAVEVVGATLVEDSTVVSTLSGNVVGVGSANTVVSFAVRDTAIDPIKRSNIAAMVDTETYTLRLTVVDVIARPARSA